MKRSFRIALLTSLILFLNVSLSGQDYPGEKSDWYGFNKSQTMQPKPKLKSSDYHLMRGGLENTFYGKQKIMQRSIIKHTHNQPFNQFTLQYHFA